jgi:hypothetical protein
MVLRNLAVDVGEADSALAAELLVSAVLGVVYGMADVDRQEAVTDFADGLAQFAAAEGAVPLLATVGALVPGRGAAVPPSGEAPAWVPELGRVHCTGTYAYGDIYGDQVSYLAMFAYEDAQRGGPEHAVISLVDHNLGFVKDMFVVAPAEHVPAAAEAGAAEDPELWFRPAAAEELRSAVTRHLAYTDELADLPGSESLSADRAIALARLALLPDGAAATEPEPLTAKERGLLRRSFKASAPAKALTIAPETVSSCVDLILDWAGDQRDGEPLRWSPAAVDLFLRDWATRKAGLDDAGLAALAAVLDAWVQWAGRRRKLPATAVAATRAAIVGSK